MKVLFALDRYRARSGGADRLARGVTDALARAGHSVRVLEAGPAVEMQIAPTVTLRAVSLPKGRIIRDTDLRTLRWNHRWGPIVAAEIESYGPDLVVTQNMLAPATVMAARQSGVRSAILFHGWRCLSPDFFYHLDPRVCNRPGFSTLSLKDKLKWPWIKRALAAYDAAYRGADVIVANSAYAAQVLTRFFERPAEVCYPILDLNARVPCGAPTPEGPVLFVKPQEIKGVHVLLKVAQVMPERQFLVAGSTSGRLRRLLEVTTNIEVLGWVHEMESVYQRASVLLGPSQIPEPFGRVFVEAGLRGVPSVASDAGGIPESVGVGGRLVPMLGSPEQWKTAIEQTTAALEYDQLCRKARESDPESLLKEHTAARLLTCLGAG